MNRIFRSSSPTVLTMAVLVLAGLAIRNHSAAAEGAPRPSLAGGRPAARPGDVGRRRPRRRLLLGRAGRVPARQGRDQRRLRLCRRRQEDGGVRDGERRQDRPRGIRAGDLRPAPNQLRTAAADFLLGGPRSDRAQSAGSGYRARSIARRSSRPAPSRRTSRRPTSRSSIRPTRSRSRSSRRSNRTARSIRPRPIIRIT